MHNIFKKYRIIIVVVLVILALFGGYTLFNNRSNQSRSGGGNSGNGEVEGNEGRPELAENLQKKKKEVVARYKNQNPEEWGENIPGVINSIDTDEKVAVLTLDACGGGGLSDGFDRELIVYLNKEGIPAVLFINYRWIDANQDIFEELANNPLFTIANHGYLHLPLSVNGKSVYEIEGTKNPGEVADEVLYNEARIHDLTGKRPEYFRSGTAYYDEVAVQIVNDLGEKIIGYDVLGDAGATFNKNQVKEAMLSVKPGSIILAHMNHPESETAEGIKAAVPELREMGFRFVKLEDYDERFTSRDR